MLALTALTVLLATAVTARPEPPVLGGQQYLPPDQQYGPPRRNNGFGTGGISGQSGSNGGGFGNNQYLPPNQQYGAPGGNNGAGYNDGYNDTPAKYEFEYMVNDIESGNDFGHKESRDGDVTRGTYYVLLPDGRRQTVEYIADQNGYRPVVTYMQEGNGAGNGYRNDGAGNGYPGGNNGYRY
ncbi:pro-resilin [Microplitis mediator]|uniref:Cuticular protein 21 n=1 Tax=Microplitis mediator TaxID=375433 RepID=A0A650DLG7_9HYME|nr:pro-resilin [Microplitis mediator]QGT33374.1 cuticular protein 21 [Microplitis mediator]